MYVKFFGGVVLAASVSFISLARAEAQYTIKVLDSPGGTTEAYAKGINNAGQIVGYTVDANGNSHAALWNSGGLHSPLPELNTPDSYSEAYRINNAGQIVGKSRFNTNFAHATVWNAGSVTDIGVLPGASGGSFAMDINDNGVVGGSSNAPHGQHAYTWTQAGGMVDWGSFDPNSNLNFAGWNAISNNGVMAGTAYVLFSPYKASMARPGDPGITNISPAGQYSFGMALAINNSDTIVGYQNPTGQSPHPAIFNGDGTFQDLGTLGFGEGWAEDISDTGVIVGRVFGEDENQNFIVKAFVYQNGQMQDLFSLLGGQRDGWTQLFYAGAVNDSGVIVGSGEYNGEYRAFVLTPTPEPATFGAISVIGMMLTSRRRRRVV